MNVLNTLKEEIDLFRTTISDEIFILLNDFKRLFKNNDTAIYGRDEYRLKIISSIEFPDISRFTGDDEKLIRYCVVFNNMIDKIENKINLNSEAIYNNLGYKNESYTIKYDNNSKNIHVGKRSVTLMLIMLYVQYYEDIEHFLNEFIEYVIPNVKIEIRSENMMEYINTIYRIVHSMIHKCNESYNSNSEFNQFILIELFSFIESLVFINKYNGSYKMIDSNILIHECNESGCMISKLGCSKIFSNIILSSIYLWNSKYDWFDTNKFNDFVNKYGNIIKTLGKFVLYKDKYNIMYALTILYGLQFINMKDTRESIVKSNEINEDILLSHNGAISISIKDNKNLVVELQTGYPIGKNNYSSGFDSIQSYVIFDPFCKNMYNILKVCYSTKELTNELNKLGNNGYEEYIRQGDKKIMGGYNEYDVKIHLMYILLLLLFIILCSISYYMYFDEQNYKLKNNKIVS